MNLRKCWRCLLLLIFIQPTMGQNGVCDVIQESFKTEFFKTEFRVCEYDTNIILYCYTNNILECNKFEVCSKKILISNDTIYNLHPNKYSIVKPKNLIILHGFEKSKRTYKLSYWRPYSGANIIFVYKLKKQKPRLIRYTIGTF